MKRGWLIFVELIFSIIILISFYFYYYLYSHSISNNLSTYTYEDYRYLNQSCNDNNIIYVIYYNNLENYTVCIYGNKGNLSDLYKYKPYFEYLYSGENSYSPFLIIIYKWEGNSYL